MSTNVGFIITNDGYDKITNAIAGNSSSPKPSIFKISTDDFDLRSDFTASDFVNSWIEKPITNYREISENEIHFECTVPADEATSQGQSIGLFFDDGTLFGYGHLLYPLGAGSDQHYDCPLIISEATSGLDFSSVPLSRAIEWDTQGSDGTNYAKLGLLSADGTKAFKLGNDGSATVVNLSTGEESSIGRSDQDIKDLVSPMLQGFKNLLVNGCLRVRQDIIDNERMFDRWRLRFANSGGDGYLSVSEINGFDSMKATITSPADLSTNDRWVGIYNMLEGYELANAFKKNEPLTLSFLFRASETGKYYVDIRNFTDLGNGYSSCAIGFEYTSANSIQEVELHIPPYNGARPIRNDANLGFQIMLAFQNEADYQSSQVNGLWHNYSSSQAEELVGSDGVMWSKVNGAYVEFARLQLEVSEKKTDFEVRPYSLELDMCRRFFEIQHLCRGWWYSNRFGGELPYKEKRVSPTISFVGDHITVHKVWLTGVDDVDITGKNHPFSGSYSSKVLAPIAYDGTDNSNVDTQAGYGILGGTFVIDARF